MVMGWVTSGNGLDNTGLEPLAICVETILNVWDTPCFHSF